MCSQNNRRRASQSGRRQAELARLALDALHAEQPAGAHVSRWVQALQHRVDNPEAALGDLGHTMTPPMTKHRYAALLRRALQGSGVIGARQRGDQSPS